MIQAVNIRPQVKTFNPTFSPIAKNNGQFSANSNVTGQHFPSLYDNGKISRNFAVSFQANSNIDAHNIDVLKAFENLDKSVKDFDRFENVVTLDSKTGRVKVTNNKNLEKDLNVIFKKFPVLKQTVYRNNSHNGKIISHLLTTTKELVNDEEFQKLPPAEKRLAKICAMFHDAEKRVDLDGGKSHPSIGAKTIVREFSRLGFSEKNLFAMHQVVKNHHWVGLLNTGEKTKDDLALEFKDCPNAFDIAIVLAKADIKAGGNAQYIKELNEIYHPGISSEIKEKINELRG